MCLRWWRAGWRLLLVALLLAGGPTDARGRSGGGFGGSRSYRVPSYHAPFARSRPSAAPRSTTFNRGVGFPHFVFLPFFGLHPFGVLFNLLAVVALIALVVWLVRRTRRR